MSVGLLAAQSLGAGPAVGAAEAPSNTSKPANEPSDATAGPEQERSDERSTANDSEPSADARTGATSAEPAKSPAKPGLRWGESDGEPLTRRFILGIEGVVIQAPPLRPDVVRFDPRFIGRSVSLAGLGLLARLRVHPRIGVEATVRSGSVRYAGPESTDAGVVSHDQVMGDLGVLLFVARGELAHLAFDGGIGGMGTRVVYETSREGSQLFGSGLVRVGADAEFLVKRIAFVISVRAYGVFTGIDRVRNRGALFADKTVPAPVPARQTYLVASGGIAYRF